MGGMPSDVFKIIFSNRQIYALPFIVKRDEEDVRSVILAIMSVAKAWNRNMKDSLVYLLNNNIIQWKDLPGTGEIAGSALIYKFLKNRDRMNQVTRLSLSHKTIPDRLGNIVRMCVRVQSLHISNNIFDLNHLTPLTKLKILDLSKSEPINVSVLGELPLESIRIKNCLGNILWMNLNSSTSLKRLQIHSREEQDVENVPSSLTSLSLFKTHFIEQDPFQAVTQLKHLSFPVREDEYPSLKNLTDLESLEVACTHLPEGYLEDVIQIKRLKVSHSDNLPSLSSFSNLTQLFLVSVTSSNIRCLTNLTELSMVNCSYNSMTFMGLKNLKKLTLNNWKKLAEVVSFHQVPNLEVLDIRSNCLRTVYANRLTRLTCLKIDSSELDSLSLPVDLKKIAKVWISKREQKNYISHSPTEEVFLF